MKSFLKLFAGFAVGALVGGLAVHCVHLQAENDALTEALDDMACDGLDPDDCCGCCVECLGEPAVAFCRDCDYKETCPSAASDDDADGSDLPGDAVADEATDDAGAGAAAGSSELPC